MRYVSNQDVEQLLRSQYSSEPPLQENPLKSLYGPLAPQEDVCPFFLDPSGHSLVNEIYKDWRSTLNILELNQDDIDSRSYILRKLIECPGVFLDAIFQGGKLNKEKGIYTTGRVTIFFNNNSLKEYSDYASVGSCFDHETELLCIDLIAFFCLVKNKSYKKGLEEIKDHVRKSAHRFSNTGDNKINWHVQEKRPISLIDLYQIGGIERVILHDPSVNDKFICDYKNKYGNLVSSLITYTNSSGELVRLFYSLYRHYKSSIIKTVPFPPEKPYLVFNADKITNETKRLYFCKDEKEASETTLQDSFVASACPFGLGALPDADFSDLRGLSLVVKWDGSKLCEGYLRQLKLIERQHGVYFCFFYASNKILNIEELLSSPEFVLPLEQKTQVERISGLSLPGEKIANEGTIRKMLLNPIIESGTVVWLYAAEKVGKTWAGLSIAYAVSKGNRPVGMWEATEPYKVIYVDGEMPGDRLAKNIDMVMIGYGDAPGSDHRSFALYSFFEDSDDYDSILDPGWEQQTGIKLSDYDLVIMDNYYSVNENRIDVKPFFKFIRELSKTGTAVLVLDHTNADGELQGAALKRRVADLGIKFEIDGNTINVTSQFDRYGKGIESPDHKLCKVFTHDSFHFELQRCEGNELEQKTSETCLLTTKDTRLMCVHLLNKKHAVKQTDIAKVIGKGVSTISEYISSIDDVRSGKVPGKNKVSDIVTFNKTYLEWETKSREEVEAELEHACEK